MNKNTEVAYRELAELIPQGEQLLNGMNPAEGLTWKHWSGANSQKLSYRILIPRVKYLINHHLLACSTMDGIWLLFIGPGSMNRQRSEETRMDSPSARALKAIVKFRPLSTAVRN